MPPPSPAPPSFSSTTAPFTPFIPSTDTLSLSMLPTHWLPHTDHQPANGAYPPPSAPMNSILPPLPQEPRPDMAHHHHHQPPPPPPPPPTSSSFPHHYRLPGPNEWSRPPQPQDLYRQQGPPPPSHYGHQLQHQQPPPPPPQPSHHHHHHHQPPAPRQRTAIACRYCRRRKIRCSGFEATEDGRCSNCMRFNQDCIFTPVSAQTQAFVPAHTVWRGVGQPPPMYGAYGQPLPPAGHADAYGQPPRPHQQYLPSPTAGPYPAHLEPGPPGTPQDEASRDALGGRKRPHPEPHTPTLPPPPPGSASHPARRGPSADHVYPEPPSLTSPAPTANASPPYTSAPPPSQPYYAAQPPRQPSPQTAYRYEPSRASSSPHSQAPTTPSTPYYNPPPQPPAVLQPPPPNSTDGPSPPPPSSALSATAAAAAARPSMRINDLVTDSGNGRTSTDSSMLNMLNRRPM